MKVVKNFLYNMTYQILTMILPLITVPYISGVLGADGVGEYAFTYANTQYFIIFGMIGISLYGSRQIAYVRDDKNELKNTFYSIYLIQSIGMSIALILFIIFVFKYDNNYYRSLYFAQGINILAAMFDISWVYAGLEEFKKTVIRNTIVKIVSLSCIFIFVNDRQDILIYIIILALSSMIGNLSLWLYIPKDIGFKNIEIKDIKNHLRTSISLFIPQIAIQVYWVLDRTILGVMTDSTYVGYYENSQKLVKISLTVVTTIATVMMPKIANTIATNNIDKVRVYIKNSFLFAGAMSIAITFGLMGISNELAPWFFTSEFKGIDKLVTLGSLVIIPISWSSVTGTQLLVPIKRIKQYTISVTVGAIINLVFNIILINRLNAIGACISTILAECVVTLIQFYFIKDFISPAKLVKSILIFVPPGMIMYLVVRVIGICMGASILTTLVQCIIGGIIYFISVEVIYRLIYKQGTVSIVKKILNE